MTDQSPSQLSVFPIWLRFLIIGACFLGACAFGVLVPGTWGASIVRFGGIPMMAALVLWFAVSLWQTLARTEWGDTFKTYRREILSTTLLVMACGAWIHLREPHGFKIVADEPLQMATAAQMHLEHTTGTMLRGYWVEDRFVITNDMLDKRPLLFPFMVSVLHGILGYRTENGVVFNALLTPIFLGLVYWLLRQWTGRVLSAAGVLLLLSAGVFGQNLTGSGFEILNVTIYAGTGVALWLFARRRDGWSCSLFLSLIGMLVNVRYEGAVLVLPALLVFLWIVAKTPRLLAQRSLYLAPLAVVPLLLVFRVFKERPDVWQLGQLQNVATPFSAEFVQTNMGHALAFLFAGDGRFGNSPVLAVIGILGAVMFLVRTPDLIRSLWKGPSAGDALSFWAFGGLVHGVFLMFYVWARLDDLTATRLAIPLLLALAIFGVRLLEEIGTKVARPAFAPVILSLALAYLVFFYGTAATHGLYLRRNAAAETANWIDTVAKRVEPRHTLVIDDGYRHVWSLNLVGTTLPRLLVQHPDRFRFLVEHDVFSSILLVQSFVATDAMGTMKTSPWHDIADWVELETVDELRLSPGVTTRVARLGKVDWERFAEWTRRARDFPSDFSLPGEPIRAFNIEVIKNLP